MLYHGWYSGLLKLSPALCTWCQKRSVMVNTVCTVTSPLCYLEVLPVNPSASLIHSPTLGSDVFTCLHKVPRPEPGLVEVSNSVWMLRKTAIGAGSRATCYATRPIPSSFPLRAQLRQRRTEREANYYSKSSVEFENAWSFTTASLLRLHNIVLTPTDNFQTYYL